MKKYVFFILCSAVALITGCNNGNEGLLDSDSDFQESVYQLIITPKDESLPIGLTMQMEAEALRGDNSVIEIPDASTLKWSSSDKNVAEINENGLVTAKEEGPVTITATGFYQDETYSDTAYITITNSEVNGLIVTPDNQTIPVGFSQQFKAIVTFTDGTNDIDVTTNKNVTWSVSKGSEFAKIDKKGFATGVSTGDATITAIGELNGKKIETNVTLHINDVEVSDLIVTPDNETIVAGLSLQFNAKAEMSDDSTFIDVTDNEHVTWSVTEGNDVAEIDKNGLATGKVSGDATITAVGKFNGKTTTRNVTLHVSDAEVVGLDVTPIEGTVAVNSTLQFKAEATYSDSSNPTDVTDSPNVTWSVTEGNDVAEIDKNGLATGLNVGNATITATGKVNGRETEDSVSLEITEELPKLLAPVIPAADDGSLNIKDIFGSPLVIEVLGNQPSIEPNDTIEVHLYTDGCDLSTGDECEPVNDFLFCTFIANSDATKKSVGECVSDKNDSPLEDKNGTTVYIYYIINNKRNNPSIIFNAILDTYAP